MYYVYLLRSLNNPSNSDKQLFLNKFLLFDKDLIAIKALHEIAYATYKTKIVVVAGGVHGNDLEPMLERIGFQCILTEGSDCIPGLEKYAGDALDAQEHLQNATTVEETKALLGEALTIVSDSFFSTLASLGK